MCETEALCLTKKKKSRITKPNQTVMKMMKKKKIFHWHGRAWNKRRKIYSMWNQNKNKTKTKQQKYEIETSKLNEDEKKKRKKNEWTNKWTNGYNEGRNINNANNDKLKELWNLIMVKI